MCDNAIYYNSCNLWSYWDDGVTNCSLNFDFFMYQTAEQNRLQTPKFKFGIYGKESTNTSVTVSNCELYKLSYYCKQKIITPLKNLSDKLNFDRKFTEGFCIKGRNKNIYVTFLYQPLLNSPCIRFMIGEKEQSLVDTDKVFIPLIEFNSLYLSMCKAFDNFPLLTQNVMFFDMFRKYNEQVNDRFNDLDRTLYESNFKKKDSNPELEQLPSIDINNVTFDESSDDEKTTIPKQETQEEIVEKSVENEQHDDFNNFLKDNRDSFQLDLPEEKNFQPPQEMNLENTFQKKILINGFEDLEKIILSCVNSNLPLDSFKNIVYQLSGENLYDGISVKDQYSVNYIVANNVKLNFKRYLENQVSLPRYVNPIILDDNSSSNFKTDLMLFLIMCYVYISKINNDLDGITDDSINKSILCYSIKTITSPFIFNYLLRQKKDILISRISKLYSRLLDEKYFESYEKSIYNSAHKNIEMTVDHLKTQVEKLYDNVQNFKDKVKIINFFKPWMKLSYSDFDLVGDNFNSDKIKAIIDIESSKPVESTYDLSIQFLNKLGMKQQKLSNSNLVNYIKNKYPKFNDLEQIKTINVSINEIINKLDLNLYPINILRALYFWEVNPKNISYNEYCKMIDNSNLDIPQLISLLLSNERSVDDDFYNSWEIAYK